MINFPNILNNTREKLSYKKKKNKIQILVLENQITNYILNNSLEKSIFHVMCYFVIQNFSNDN